MNRVFIHMPNKFPNGPVSNYIQNLSKAILRAGYETIIATDIAEGYNITSMPLLNPDITIIPVTPSKDENIRKLQRETGYWNERYNILKKHKIDKDDKVIVCGLRNEYFLNKLFEFKKQIGFKIICCVLELFGPEDYETIEKYNAVDYIKGSVYLKADAIISISEYIDKYYINKGMKVYRFPPMVDCNLNEVKTKIAGKYHFVIVSEKDSLKAMLKAFAGLKKTELDKFELHLCSIKEETINKIIDSSEWGLLKSHTIIHDWLNYEELIALYQEMHFLVIARSVCQRTLANFPSKVPEVMSLGIVPVVSDVGEYTKYFLKDGYDSIFIQGDSVEETRKAIRKAISLNIEEYNTYSQNARITAKERFDYYVWAPKVKEMLESV